MARSNLSPAQPGPPGKYLTPLFCRYLLELTSDPDPDLVRTLDPVRNPDLGPEGQKTARNKRYR
jgi:hypothetical protein